MPRPGVAPHWTTVPEPLRDSVSRVTPPRVIPQLSDPESEPPFWALNDTILGTFGRAWLQGSATFVYCDTWPSATTRITVAGPAPVTLRVSPAEVDVGGAVVEGGIVVVEGTVVPGADVVVVEGVRVVLVLVEPAPEEGGFVEAPGLEPQAPAARPTVASRAMEPPRCFPLRRLRRSAPSPSSRGALRRASPAGRPRPTCPLSRGPRRPNHGATSQKGDRWTSSWYSRRVPVKNVSHIAIGVRDMERSLPFWTDVVGLHVTLDTVEEFTIGGEVVRRRGVYLREREGPDEAFVVLDQQLTRPRDENPKGLFEVGVHHVGFWVDNLDEIAARARAAGVPIIVEPSERGADTVTYGEPPGGRVRGMFVRDPDDNVVQFDERVA